MTPEEAQKIIQEYLQELTAKKTAEIKAVGENSLKKTRKTRM